MTDSFESRREAMVDSQILTNKVTDPLLEAALRAVPREAFAPKALRAVAYLDEDLEVGPGRFLMEPMIFARLLQALNLNSEDVVLEVACGAGYGAAVMARLASTVVALDAEGELAERAGEALNEQGIDNVAMVTGDVATGLPEQGPYSAIFFNGAVSAVPDAYFEQLADGGRLVVVERGEGIGRAKLYTRRGDSVAGRELFDAQIPLLPEFEAEETFVF